MTRMIAFLVTIFTILVSAIPVEAQEPGKVYRIGYLTVGAPNKTFQVRMAAFRQGLQELGYVEGKNVVIVERYGKGRRERIPKLAADLVRLDVDVIVTHGGTLVADRAAKNAGKTIPIVFAVSADPVGAGYVVSLARPGGNITGLSDAHSELVPKRFEILKEVVPSASRVAVLWSSVSANGARQLKALQAVAPRFGMTVLPVDFARPADFDRVISTIESERPDALNVLGWSLLAAFRKRITDLALNNRLPTVFTGERSILVGGLMSYGARLPDLYRRAATFVDKILKGAKPADLPVEQPTRFYLTVNLKTAKALGITCPPSILLRADRVIE